MVSKVNAASATDEVTLRPRSAPTTPRKRKTANGGVTALPGSEFGGNPALVIHVINGQPCLAKVRKRAPATKKTKKANKA
jgi:hypothetical protein